MFTNGLLLAVLFFFFGQAFAYTWNNRVIQDLYLNLGYSSYWFYCKSIFCLALFLKCPIFIFAQTFNRWKWCGSIHKYQKVWFALEQNLIFLSAEKNASKKRSRLRTLCIILFFCFSILSVKRKTKIKPNSSSDRGINYISFQHQNIGFYNIAIWLFLFVL